MKANLRYWNSVLREAERELDAAKTVAAMKVAAAKLMTAEVKLQQLQASVDSSVSHSAHILQAD